MCKDVSMSGLFKYRRILVCKMPICKPMIKFSVTRFIKLKKSAELLKNNSADFFAIRAVS